jgi:ElaB/YqjD/DUF883 family membrane-anchored ribosome-binding protein
MATTSNVPKEVGNEANKAFNAAKETATDMADKAKQAASSMAETAGKKANEAASAVGSSMKSFGEKIKDSGPSEGYLGQASKSVASSLEEGGKYLQEQGLSGLAEDVGSLIKRNPVPAVLVAIGVGFMMGRMLKK